MCCILPTAVLQQVWVQRQQEGGEKGKEGEAEAIGLAVEELQRKRLLCSLAL
jgi:hypothetical protein